MATLKDLLSDKPDDGAYYPKDNVLRGQLQQWQDDVYQALATAGKAEHREVKFGGTVPLHLLPADQQILFMGRYRKIISLDTALRRMAAMGPNTVNEVLEKKYGIKGDLNVQIANVWSHLTGDRTIGTDSPFGRFQGAEPNTLLGRVYGAINLQMYDRPTRGTKTGISAPGTSVRNYFGMGSIQKLENLEKPTTVDLKNKNLLVFDIETAGFRPGSIREVAFKEIQMTGTGTIDYGKLVSDKTPTIALRPIQGTRGTVMGKSGAVNLDEFLKEKFGLDATVSGKGDDFIDKIMPFLKKVSQTDMIVGHNIETFDFPQIFEALAGTSRYKKDKIFKAEIDSLQGVISGKTVDTLRLARQAPNLAGLKTSLLTEGEDIFSIQNLLLETDLAKRIGIENVATAMGYDMTKGVFTGLHHGGVDTLVNVGILDFMPHLQVVNILKSGLTPAEGDLARKIIGAIQTSAAITPFTDIRDPDAIDPAIKRLLEPGEKINPIEQEVLRQRRFSLGHSQQSVQDAIAEVDPRRLAESVGGFDRLIGRRPGVAYSSVYDTLVKPSAVEFEAYQQRLRRLRYGFAGLSYEERLFGTALSDITLRGQDGPARQARETLISKFEGFDPDKIKYVTGSKKVTLPAQILEEAKILSKPGEPAFYNLSTVQATAFKTDPSINLAYKFTSEEDIGKVTDVLARMRGSEVEFSKVMGLEYGDGSRRAYANFVKAFEQGGLVESLRSVETEKYGVSVAQIIDPDAVNEIIALEQAANMDTKYKDASKLQFRLFHAGLDKKTGEVTTAGAVLDKGLQKTDSRSIARSVAMAQTLFDPTAEKTGFGAIRRSIRLSTSAAFYDKERIVSESMPKIYDFLETKVLPRAPKIALGAVAVGIGAYFLNKKRKNDRYDIDFESSYGDAGPGRFAVANTLQARIDAGIDGGRVQVDPLATASLTQHLYYNANGQHKTDWDRNTSIYGGVL